MSTGELERLARDRELVTRELHPPSAFYGHAEALRRYAGLSPRARPKVAIEHGVSFTQFVWELDVEAAVPTFLCAAPRRAARFAEVAPADRVAVPIGPMISYAEPAAAPDPGRRTLLAFPAHSTHHLDAVYDIEQFARRLEERRGDWDTIRVCLYWKDVVRGTHRAYAERGFECVTAGHIYDPEFLQRLRAILTGATAVISNEVGTYLFYAVALGKPVWIVDDDVDYAAESAAIISRDRSDPAEWDELTAAIRTTFAGEPAEPTADQMALVEDLAGLSSHHTPAQMRALLAEAEQRYRAFAAPARRVRDRARAEAGHVLGAVRSRRG